MGLGYSSRPRLQRRRAAGRPAACALLAALPFALLPGQALAQSDTAAADTRATVMEPGSMMLVSNMDFGEIAQPGTAGTVTLTPTATPTCATSSWLIKTGACQPAEWAVMGRRNWIVRIREMNGGTVVLTGPGGATMTVDDLSIRVLDMSPVNGGGNPSGMMGRYRILEDSGIGRFRIGGTLHVGASQAPGVYDGTLVMQVLFN